MPQRVNKTILEAALSGLEFERQKLEQQIHRIRVALHSATSPQNERQPDHVSAEPRRRRRLSAAARKRIAAAQKKR
jgi:hypothetical protein